VRVAGQHRLTFDLAQQVVAAAASIGERREGLREGLRDRGRRARRWSAGAPVLASIVVTGGQAA
jgi:triphosphoribosyl-dephospho-CoA synthetase